jgi:hypothetical protein
MVKYEEIKRVMIDLFINNTITRDIVNFFENSTVNSLEIFANYFVTLLLFFTIVMFFFMLLKCKANINNKFSLVIMKIGFLGTFLSMTASIFSFNLLSSTTTMPIFLESLEVVRVALIPVIVGTVCSAFLKILNYLFQNKKEDNADSDAQKELEKISKELLDVNKNLLDMKSPKIERPFRRINKLKTFGIKKK